MKAIELIEKLCYEGANMELFNTATFYKEATIKDFEFFFDANEDTSKQAYKLHKLYCANEEKVTYLYEYGHNQSLGPTDILIINKDHETISLYKLD